MLHGKHWNVRLTSQVYGVHTTVQTPCPAFVLFLHFPFSLFLFRLLFLSFTVNHRRTTRGVFSFSLFCPCLSLLPGLCCSTIDCYHFVCPSYPSYPSDYVVISAIIDALCFPFLLFRFDVHFPRVSALFLIARTFLLLFSILNMPLRLFMPKAKKAKKPCMAQL